MMLGVVDFVSVSICFVIANLIFIGWINEIYDQFKYYETGIYSMEYMFYEKN